MIDGNNDVSSFATHFNGSSTGTRTPPTMISINVSEETPMTLSIVVTTSIRKPTKLSAHSVWISLTFSTRSFFGILIAADSSILWTHPFWVVVTFWKNSPNKGITSRNVGSQDCSPPARIAVKCHRLLSKIGKISLFKRFFIDLNVKVQTLHYKH